MNATALRLPFFLFVFMCIAAYGVFVSYPMLFGPSVSVTTPHEFEVSESGALTLSGSAQHFASLRINGRNIVPHADGTFGERMLLERGSNTFTFDATDSFGTTAREHVTVVYAPEERPEKATAFISQPFTPLLETLSF
jgi:hypothetical protein